MKEGSERSKTENPSPIYANEDVPLLTHPHLYIYPCIVTLFSYAEVSLLVLHLLQHLLLLFF